MTPEEESKFTSLRHRFYRLGKSGPQVLSEMGFHFHPEPSNETCRATLFVIAEQGRLPELENLIDEHEREILARIGHDGNPCTYCHLSIEDRKPGSCPVRKKQVQP